MVAQESRLGKLESLDEPFTELKAFVIEAARVGRAEHVVAEKLFRGLLALGKVLMGEFFSRQGTGDLGETLTLPDARQVRRLPQTQGRPLLTIFGEFVLERAVYGTREGQAVEFVPLDARLELPESKFSYLLQNWDQLLATEQPYGQVSHIMNTILGLKQHVDSLERMSRAMSAQAEEFCWFQPPPPPEEEGEILVETGDGKGVPIRHAADAPPIHDHQHRRGPKPDRKRMATLGAVYSVDRFVRTPEEVLEALFHHPQTLPPESARARPRPQHKRVYARLDDPSDQEDPVNGQAAAFGWMDQQVRERMANLAVPVEVVCVMDGGVALWDSIAELQEDLPRVEILDLLHVTSRLWQAAHLFHAAGSAAAERFVHEHALAILQGRVTAVIRGLRSRGTRRGFNAARQRQLEVICCYYHKNRDRMRYDEYLRRGYPIASGVIEGACRHVVKDRLERTGMSWTLPGAQAMLNLRAIATSEQWESFFKHRVERETKRLYPHRALIPKLEWPLAA